MTDFRAARHAAVGDARPSPRRHAVTTPLTAARQLAHWTLGAAVIAALLTGSAPVHAAGTSTTTTTAWTVAVGAVADAPADAVHYDRLMDVPWSSLPAGSTVLVGPGSQPGPVTITAQGTAAAPILVKAADKTQRPEISGSVDFQGAAYVKLQQLVVQDSPYAAVVIRRGSHHIAVANSLLRRSAMGVSITDGAGTGMRIVGNRIEDSATVGIAVDRVNSVATDRSRILRNTIVRSGHHGMEIQGSRYLIERNTVSDSGLTMGGTSGIHIYSSNAAEDSGDGNLIRRNFSYNNHDTQMSDGNGIQVDQWCDGNEVSYNVVWNNDGAGIILFDAADNRVFGNTAKSNARDPARTHGDRGELILNSAGTALDRTRGNQVWNNLLVADQPGVPALKIDTTTSNNGNTVSHNLLDQRNGDPVLQFANTTARTATDVDAATGGTGTTVEAPSFASEATPLAHGLKLVAPPQRRGAMVNKRIDMASQTPQGQASYLGAYYAPPR